MIIRVKLAAFFLAAIAAALLSLAMTQTLTAQTPVPPPSAQAASGCSASAQGIDTPPPEPSIRISGLVDCIEAGKSDGFYIQAKNLVPLRRYKVEVRVEGAPSHSMGFNSSCSPTIYSRSFSGYKSRTFSPRLYGCRGASGGSVYATLTDADANRQIDRTDSYVVFITTPTATPTPRPAATLPNPPSGFTASAGPSSGSIILTWLNPGAPGIAKYQYRTLPPGGKWGNFRDIPNSDSGTTSYTISGLSPGLWYGIQLRALNGIGPGKASRADAPAATPMPQPTATPRPTATPTPQPTATPRPAATLPNPPSGFTASAGPSSGSIILTWLNPGAPGITKYQYRTLPPGGKWGNFRDIPNSDSGTTSYTIRGLSPGLWYGIQLRALNGIGPGKASRADAPAATLPNPPSGFTARAGPSPGSIILTWLNPGAPGITKYQYRTLPPGGKWGNFRDIPNSGSGTTSYTIRGLSPGLWYGIQLRALNGIGPGKASRADAPAATPPNPPSGFTASAGPSTGSIILAWINPGAPGIAKYQYRTLPPGGKWGNFRDIPNSGSGTTSYAISGLSPGLWYGIQLRALNGIGPSKASRADAPAGR